MEKAPLLAKADKRERNGAIDIENLKHPEDCIKVCVINKNLSKLVIFEPNK